MSEDQGRGRTGAGHEADPAWLRHDFDEAAPGDAAPDDGWLRHDVSHEGVPVDEPARRVVDEPHAADGHASEGYAEESRAEERHVDEGRPERRRHAGGSGAGSMVRAATKEFVIVIGMALVLSFVVKTWLLQAFYIPSGSMEDTLVLNDRVIVSKLTPGAFDLKRGDIVVFSDPGDWVDPLPKAEHGPAVTAIRQGLMFVGLLPNDAEDHLIKRVIGLPGDRVVCCDEGERLTVNGVPLVESYIKPGDAPSSTDFDITVPEGSVWVMGDHRSDSSDSRFHDPAGNGADGSVPQSLVVGRAVALVWPLDHLTWLSNPKATFAKVPAAGSGTTPAPAPTPAPTTTTGGG
ncbi:signal peptidase I [Knoellia sp. 3-2P3]|uniref:signal peptidase I n=1 Tax=unclassified Knoellia TaxID=2618719 RepID=UPI0031F39BFB